MAKYDINTRTICSVNISLWEQRSVDIYIYRFRQKENTVLLNPLLTRWRCRDKVSCRPQPLISITQASSYNECIDAYKRRHATICYQLQHQTMYTELKEFKQQSNRFHTKTCRNKFSRAFNQIIIINSSKNIQAYRPIEGRPRIVNSSVHTIHGDIYQYS